MAVGQDFLYWVPWARENGRGNDLSRDKSGGGGPDKRSGVRNMVHTWLAGKALAGQLLSETGKQADGHISGGGQGPSWLDSDFRRTGQV
jgi:hypothetical protein